MKKQLLPPSEFLLRFFFAFAASYVALIALSQGFLSNAFAFLEFNALKALNVQGIGLVENYIVFEEAVFNLNESCIGIVSASMILGLVFTSVGVSNRNRWKVLVCGVALMALVNFFRVLAVLYSVQFYGAEFAEALHVSSWFVMALATVLVWYYLVRLFEKKVKRLSDVVKA